jgi:hypothetical protein
MRTYYCVVKCCHGVYGVLKVECSNAAAAKRILRRFADDDAIVYISMQAAIDGANKLNRILARAGEAKCESEA